MAMLEACNVVAASPQLCTENSSGCEIGLWRILGAGNWPKLGGAEQACTKEIQIRSAVHLSLYELQLGVLTLGLSVRPGLRQSGVYTGAILNNALREGAQQAGHRISDPRLQIGAHAASDHAMEPVHEIARRHQRRHGVLDDRHRAGDGLG